MAPPPPPPVQAGFAPSPPAPYGAPPARTGASKAAIVVVLAIVILAGVGIAALSFMGGGGQVGDCVEEWQYQDATRKENWTRAECDAFCSSGVNSNHLACYFEGYRIR